MRKPATRETKAGACHLGLAQNKTGFSLLQCPSIGHEPTTTSAARRARAANALATPPPERERAQWRNRVCAHAGRLPVGDRGWYVGTRPCTEERGLSLVQWPSKGHGSTTTSATRRARAASARDAPPPERCKRSGAIACAHTRKWAVLEAAAGTSEHGVAPKERGHSLVQWPFIREDNTKLFLPPPC